MKRSLSAPCLADEDNNGTKKVREESNEPTGREYLQLALARVLELQRQVKDDTYTTDNTSDLGESDSEEDVMKEVLIKVFKDLPGSSPAVASIINKATRSQPPEIRVIRDKRVQLSGYDTCRRVAIEFMNTVVKNTSITERDFERFEMGRFSKIETKIADHKTGLIDNRAGQSCSFENNLQNSADVKNSNTRSVVGNFSRNNVISSQVLPRGGIIQFGELQNLNNKQSVNNSNQVRNFISAEENSNNINQNRKNYFRNVVNQTRSLMNLEQTQRGQVVSRDYEIRVRMLKGLDLHLATKQRDFTARLMRQ